jgi:hypothetical protein
MIDIALFHLRTARAGSAAYNEPRQRGTLEIWHDQKRYVYDLNGLSVTAGECRRFIENAWESELFNDYKLTGKYPSYSID